MVMQQTLKSWVNEKIIRVSNRFNGLPQEAVNLSNIISYKQNVPKELIYFNDSLAPLGAYCL
jgi:hypothetical protein